MHDRELPGIGSHTLNHSIDGIGKTSAQAGRLVLVPIARFNQFRTSGGRKNDWVHYCSSSAFKASHGIPLRRSWSSVSRRRSSSASCAAVKGSWSASRLSHSCEIRARRSSGVRRASSSWVSMLTPFSLRKIRHRLKPENLVLRHSSLSLPRSTTPSYPSSPPETLHAINPVYALLTISRENHGPNPLRIRAVRISAWRQPQKSQTSATK
jgi:hypothetical protein